MLEPPPAPIWMSDKIKVKRTGQPEAVLSIDSTLTMGENNGSPYKREHKKLRSV